MIAFQVNSAYNLKPEIVCFQFKLPIWAIALDVFILRLDFFIVVNACGMASPILGNNSGYFLRTLAI